MSSVAALCCATLRSSLTQLPLNPQQFHIAYSEMVTGACVFSGQPYRCAVTKFQYDTEVEQTDSSSIPYCEGCHENKTLIYGE